MSLGYNSVSSLAPGQLVNYSGTIYPPQAGYYTIVYYADFYNQVLESSENNNVGWGGFLVYSDNSTTYCGDGICNNNETCATCTTDCGVCPPTCAPGYICNGTSVMYRSYDCSLQLVQKCPYQCTNGGCIVPIGGGRKPIPVPIREEAQVIGPINNGQLFWLGLGVVVIAGVGIYAFMGSSKKK